jgi:hypothetical protein
MLSTILQVPQQWQSNTQIVSTFSDTAADDAESAITCFISTEIPEEQFTALMASINAPELTSTRKIVTRG